MYADAAIMFLVAGIIYVFLRSLGGEGFTAKPKMPPASTPKGKQVRVLAGVMVVLWLATNLFIITREGDRALRSIILTGLAAALIVIIPLIKKEK